MNDDLCDKYFVKLPGDLDRNIYESWKQQFSERRNLGIGPRITYTFIILEDKCKEVTLQEQLKKSAYAFCKIAIYTPQAYGQYNTFKKKLRKSTTYKKEYKPYAGNKYVKRRGV